MKDFYLYLQALMKVWLFIQYQAVIIFISSVELTLNSAVSVVFVSSCVSPSFHHVVIVLMQMANST